MVQRVILAVVAVICFGVSLSAAEKQERLPIPPKEDLLAAQRLMKEAFETSWAASVEDEAKASTFVDELIAVARMETTKPAEKAVLFQHAAQRATLLGDASRTVAAVYAMGDIFEVDTIKYAQRELGNVERYARSDPQKVKLARAYFDLGQRAVAEERLEPAEDALQRARRYARPNEALSKRVDAALDQIREIQRANINAKRAITTLRRSPGDPAASNVYGRYRCFFLNDWVGGLPYLANSSDKKLKGIARTDKADPSQPTAMIALADAWWTFSESLEAYPARNVRSRAAYWYQKALPKTEGLVRRKVEARLQAFAESKQTK